ncbi:unnamed protein product, partial [Polarella glacialis]
SSRRAIAVSAAAGAGVQGVACRASVAAAVLAGAFGLAGTCDEETVGGIRLRCCRKCHIYNMLPHDKRCTSCGRKTTFQDEAADTSGD